MAISTTNKSNYVRTEITSKPSKERISCTIPTELYKKLKELQFKKMQLDQVNYTLSEVVTELLEKGLLK